MAHTHQRPSERCQCCVTQDDVWKQRLKDETHGCAAKRERKTHLVCKKCQANPVRCNKCKAAYDDASWSQYERQYHRTGKTKIVCKACRAQGFHPRNLKAYTCQTCKGKFGTLRFNKALMKKERRKKKTHLVCTTCRTNTLRCTKCKVAYDDACWTKYQRQNHREKQVKVVCKACRAQGFHPKNLDAYTCQTCKGNFGTLRFNKVLLQNSKQRSSVRLRCMQCIAQEAEKKATATA